LYAGEIKTREHEIMDKRREIKDRKIGNGVREEEIGKGGTG
jgi:hypothetical protein